MSTLGLKWMTDAGDKLQQMKRFFLKFTNRNDMILADVKSSDQRPVYTARKRIDRSQYNFHQF